MWNCIKTAIQGKSHIVDNTPCQDKVFSLNYNDNCIVSLADGAGSAKYSHLGAEAVTKFICQDIDRNFEQYFKEEDGFVIKKLLIQSIQQLLQSVAEYNNCTINDLASTLLMVAIKNDNFIIIHIGDGVIGYLSNKELKVASKPKNGEFVNTTIFTTSTNVLASMKIIKGKINDITGFVLMSDGTETSLYHKKENRLAPAIKNIMKYMNLIPTEKVQEQLDQSMEKIIRNNTNDDCSIILIAKEHFAGFNKLSDVEKCNLLQINNQNSKQFARFNLILNFLQKEKTLREISVSIRLKQKLTQKKYINKLLDLNLIEKNGNRYKTILIMDK